MVALAVVPLMLFYAVFLFFPMAYSLFVSFYDWPGASLIKSPRFIGLGNYTYALFTDSLFLTGLKNTVWFTAMNVPFGAATALTIAVLVNSVPRWKSPYRILYFLPVLTSEVAAGIIWKWIYQPRFGLINSLLFQITDALHWSVQLPQWLDDPKLAMPSIVLTGIWKGSGYTMVIFLAGLQGISQSYYDAAKVDGAGAWPTFRHITLPLLRPTMIFVIITGVIGSLQAFASMYVMTKGGPVNATRTIVYVLYDQAFSNFRFGYASSLAVLLFIVILAATFIQFRFLRVNWDY